MSLTDIMAAINQIIKFPLFIIVRKFREKGIEIPFPQGDLHLRSPLPLPHVPTRADGKPLE
ncbi:MAG: hypothetical protein ACE5HO_14545 [bacterium]